MSELKLTKHNAGVKDESKVIVQAQVMLPVSFYLHFQLSFLTAQLSA